MSIQLFLPTNQIGTTDCAFLFGIIEHSHKRLIVPLPGENTLATNKNCYILTSRRQHGNQRDQY